MSHLHRFYIPDGLSSVTGNEKIPLSDEEAHHALRVLRLRNDEPVAFFDGAGRHGQGHFEAVSKRVALVRVTDIAYTAPENPAIVLLQACLQRDKAMESIVRRSAELGVQHICFFDADHAQRPKKNRLDKWRRIAIEACKQCGRPWLPTLEEQDSLASALESARGERLALLLEASPEPLPDLRKDMDAVTLVVGPEGDFSPEETALLRSRCRHISLGDYVYRAEVAATLGLTLLKYQAGLLGPRQ